MTRLEIHVLLLVSLPFLGVGVGLGVGLGVGRVS